MAIRPRQFYLIQNFQVKLEVEEVVLFWDRALNQHKALTLMETLIEMNAQIYDENDLYLIVLK